MDERAGPIALETGRPDDNEPAAAKETEHRGNMRAEFFMQSYKWSVASAFATSADLGVRVRAVAQVEFWSTTIVV